MVHAKGANDFESTKPAANSVIIPRLKDKARVDEAYAVQSRRVNAAVFLKLCLGLRSTVA
jgi:hypothetical protein